MKKIKSTAGQRKLYVLLNILTFLLILNFFSLGFLFAFLFNLSGGMQVLVTFSSLFIGCYFWAEIVIFNETYIY